MINVAWIKILSCYITILSKNNNSTIHFIYFVLSVDKQYATSTESETLEKGRDVNFLPGEHGISWGFQDQIYMKIHFFNLILLNQLVNVYIAIISLSWNLFPGGILQNNFLAFLTELDQ